MFLDNKNKEISSIANLKDLQTRTEWLQTEGLRTKERMKNKENGKYVCKSKRTLTLCGHRLTMS